MYDPVKKTIVESRDAVFNETGPNESTSTSDSEEEAMAVPRATEAVRMPIKQDEEAAENENTVRGIEDAPEEVIQENVRQQQKMPERKLRDRSKLKPPGWAFLYELDCVEHRAPITFQEAVSGSDKTKWSEAIRQELQAHENNETWTMVRKKPENKLIDSKRIFKIIQGSSTGECCFKARLCARGFMQWQGVDYNETFAPVIRHDSLRVFLAKATQEGYELMQFDVCTAFLYGELEEEIFMKVPEGRSMAWNSHLGARITSLESF